jgi:shikimate dehydrogenase
VPLLRLGLIGFPLGHSISPAFQQPALDSIGVDARYELWETPPDALPALSARLRQGDCLGANVTIPHKQAIMPYLDRVDPTAQAVGAVNTIVKRAGQLLGYNTDVAGFQRAVEQDGETPLSDRRLLVLGAGGAARAVVAAGLLAGAEEIVVAARRREQSDRLVEELAAAGLGRGRTRLKAIALGDTVDLAATVSRASVLVNATPLGTAHRPGADSSPLDLLVLHRDLLVADLVYNPPETPLLRAARLGGARAVNGLPMLIYQGAAAFELWTGRPAPIELMRRHAREALSV